ncbi:glycoside hydrolase family 95 protein [Snuella sedimenti]|uniref:Glycoside hydrolase family 95 protein n=1 Tax=Snuella sedimenti TaxID=2798802 RepID=A0A8J7J357_9FLAO|nr:glycoside hydrolase family 95 protein [Snuella sedimenti]MBJ6368887.1 glycoside hydrolase family 95 protein [Snuella sedimenti]
MKYFQLFLFSLFFASSFAQENLLWYNTPASNEGKASWLKESLNRRHKNNPDKAWENFALPIGNGSIGAMIFGGIEEERIQFNEKTVWEGGPRVRGYHPSDKTGGWEHLRAIRKLVFEKKYDEAEALASEHLKGTYENSDIDNPFYGKYQTFGECYFKTGIEESKVTDYKRFLDIGNGISGVDFKYNDVIFSRRYFVSYPDQVMVLKFSANKAGQQNIVFSMDSPHKNKTTYLKDEILFEGNLEHNNMPLVCRIKVKIKGGNVISVGDEIQITQADEVVFILSSDTDYQLAPPSYSGENPMKNTRKTISKATKKTYQKLLENHLADYSRIYNRVKLNLNGEDKSNIPTDERLEAYEKNPIDKGLEELYYNYGRYLLISSSREGNLPANLQGIWSNEIVPAWQADYHLNINLQMNYWNAEQANLSECNIPMLKFIENLSKEGRRTAKAYFNADGWNSNITTNAYGFTAPNNGNYMFWSYFPLSGAWLTQHIWDHYEFTMDKKYLKEIGYPILKGQAQFLSDYLVEDPEDGTLVSNPSWSPEHGKVSVGATMDHQMARGALRFASKAASVLKVDFDLAKQWENMSKRISPDRIGQYGQLQEWKEDRDDPKNQHRHVSHLFGVYPGRQINPTITPKLANAAIKSLEFRGDKATGWSIGWKINLWARFLKGDRAHKLLENMLRYRTAKNLFCLHPPFQIDGNFGAAAGITEMLLQSQNGEVHLLPALPKIWDKGSVKGLKARGNYTIDIEWNEGKLLSAKIKSNTSGVCKIRYKDKIVQIKMNFDEVITLDENLNGLSK